MAVGWPWVDPEQAFRDTPDFPLDGNIIRTMFFFRSNQGESWMFRIFAEEAAALASLALFLGMVAIWAQVIATL
jgi:hypothetical protein